MKLRRTPSSESGVILLLTLFVILITYALVAQLTMGTAVSFQVAENSANRMRMRRAAMDVAGEELLRLLADDMPGGEAEEAAAEAADGLGDPAGFGDQGAAPGEEGEGEEEEDDGSNSDSRNDDWWRPTRFPIGDMEVHGFVQDENGKFNILTVFHPDPEERETARERFVRILDFLREDFDDDLSISEAERILDEFIVWVEGDLRSQKYPPTFRHSTQLLGQLATENQLAAATGEGSEESSESEQIIRELYLPYSLEELMLLESVEEDMFYDAIRPNDEIAPGIESVFTVYTSINLDPPSEEELGTPEEQPGDLSDVGADDAASEETGDLSEDSSLSDPIGGLDDILEAPAAFGTAINLNTCHPAVLYGLQPTSLFPTYFVEQILRYRNEVDEEALQEMEGEDREYDAIELARAVFREDDQTPFRYFRNLEDLTNLDGWEDRLEPEQREAFEQLIGVQSDVFSVYLWCRIPDPNWEQEDHYEEPPGAVLRLKAVVWRRQGEDGAKFVFLEPWHEVSRTRWHIPDFQDEIGVYREPEY